MVAEFNQQLQTFVVASQLLAKAFGVKLDENFKQKLVDKLPLSTVAETQGNKIHKIKIIPEIVKIVKQERAKFSKY